MAKRYDKKHRLLKTGESERSDGYYQYHYTDRKGKRHTITAGTLEELRKREEQIARDKSDGIRTDTKNVSLDDIFDLWSRLKGNTYQNYCYMYQNFVSPEIGMLRIAALKRSDLKAFYNTLVDERGLKIATVDNIHTVLYQMLDVAVEDGYIRMNISDNLLKELKQSHNIGYGRKKALTIPEQELFLVFLRKENTPYHHWYPIFSIMTNTGMGVGEITGLRWQDIDLERGMIEVNHTLVYYDHAGGGCYFSVHTPKTKAGNRTIPMLEDVIFINWFGNLQHQGTLNKALQRIIRDCND